jgi:hypothetical protein
MRGFGAMVKRYHFFDQGVAHSRDTIGWLLLYARALALYL